MAVSAAVSAAMQCVHSLLCTLVELFAFIFIDVLVVSADEDLKNTHLPVQRLPQSLTVNKQRQISHGKGEDTQSLQTAV